MEEIIKVAAGELITATKFNEMIEKIAKIEELENKYSEMNNRLVDLETKSKTLKIISNSIGMTFMPIPAGEYMMGSEIKNSERPVHKVTIDKPFYLGIYPVTKLEWNNIMEIDFTPEFYHFPVEIVCCKDESSFPSDDVQEFINKLNRKEGTTKYRLPSEAEWEYAARAGTKTDFSFGNDWKILEEYAWYYNNSNQYFQRVGEKKPNPWGLYDMHGNVKELVQDKFHKDYYGAPNNGSAWESGDSDFRVSRGGECCSDPDGCRSSFRESLNPAYSYSNLGFRLLREL